EVKLVELPLMTVLKRRRDASLRRPRIDAATYDARSHGDFESAVNGDLHRQWSILVDDGLVRLREVIDGDAKPGNVGKQQTTYGEVDKRLLQICIAYLRRLRTDEVAGHGIELISECKPVEVYVARKVRDLKPWTKAKVLGDA